MTKTGITSVAYIFATLLISTPLTASWHLTDEVSSMWKKQKKNMSRFYDRVSSGFRNAFHTHQLDADNLLKLKEQENDVHVEIYLKNLEQKDITAQRQDKRLTIYINGKTLKGTIIIVPDTVYVELENTVEEETTHDSKAHKNAFYQAYTVSHSFPETVLIPEDVNISYHNHTLTVVLPKVAPIVSGTKANSIPITFK